MSLCDLALYLSSCALFWPAYFAPAALAPCSVFRARTCQLYPASGPLHWLKFWRSGIPFTFLMAGYFAVFKSCKHVSSKPSLPPFLKGRSTLPTPIMWHCITLLIASLTLITIYKYLLGYACLSKQNISSMKVGILATLKKNKTKQ